MTASRLIRQTSGGEHPKLGRRHVQEKQQKNLGESHIIRPVMGNKQKSVIPKGQTMYRFPVVPATPETPSDTSDTSTKGPDHELIFGLTAFMDFKYPRLAGPYDVQVQPSKPPAGGEEDDDFKESQKYHTHLDGARSPISDTDAIYDDIVENLQGTNFQRAIDLLSGRRLRLFTMCSGTEAPVLALQKLKAALQRRNFNNFDIFHVGSCEIIPFKQAYIQTNFAPPLIFRDVTDFFHSAKSNPLTVFGAPTAAPENVDILVAGSSCVDYSNLNKTPKEFEVDGESWATMKGISEYAEKHRPAIVILENVTGAPWNDIIKYWKRIGYICQFVKVDTKDFYLPQTRQRGYMFGIDENLIENTTYDHVQKFAKFREDLRKLARRATSPYTAFTYFPDDPTFQVVTKDMMTAMAGRKGTTEWISCYLRHARYRGRPELDLGFERPLTQWKNNGSSFLPDYFSMRLMMGKKCERILDTLDIICLRSLAERCYDPYFKNRVIDLSQNVDRETDGKQFGIIPCITPDGQVLDTLRGGILSGKELLALQGIPVDELTLNTETSKQLTDLAGNAMTATVVAAVVASALSATCYESGGGLKSVLPKRDGAEWQISPKPAQMRHSEVIEDWEAKKMQLREVAFRLEPPATLNYAKSLAYASRQLCLCEGYSGQNPGPFFTCQDCGHTVCSTCKGNPKHKLQPLSTDGRVPPSDFIAFAQDNLPRSLKLTSGASAVPVSRVAPFDDQSTNQKYWKLLTAAAEGTFRYSKMKRSRLWKIEFISPHGRLEFQLSPSSDLCHDQAMECQWLLFANCGQDETIWSDLRTKLQHPVARMVPQTDVLSGLWELWTPPSKITQLTVSGSGPSQPSRESRIGIRHSLWKHRLEFTSITVLGLDPDQPEGTAFELRSECAAPHRSFYRSAQPVRGKTLFFFIDSNPLEAAKEDSYVITPDPHRRNNHELRLVRWRFPKGWRMNIEDNQLLDGVVSCHFLDDWTSVETMALSPTSKPARIWSSEAAPITINTMHDCSNDKHPDFAVEVPITEDLCRHYPLGTDFIVDLAGTCSKLSPFEWLLTKADLNASHQWTVLESPNVDSWLSDCDCYPPRPRVTWYWVWLNGKNKSKIIKPFEDPEEASKFEAALKKRPSSVTATVRCYEHTVLVEIHLNPQTLIHRAVAALRPSLGDNAPRTEWRLVKYNPLDQVADFKAQTLVSNDWATTWHGRLANAFRRDLWVGQRQLLGWALLREAGLPDWEEVQQSDTPIPSLSSSLEARASLTQVVRGGVIADEVGAGKTTSALALFAADLAKAAPSSPNLQIDLTLSKIHSEATLILVPAELIDQWKDQIDLCFGEPDGLVITIKSIDELIKAELEDFIGCKIVLAAWTLLDDAKYWECLRVLSYSPNVPFSGGRAFEQWTDLALDNLGKMLVEYDKENLDRLWQQRETGKSRLDRFHQFPAYRSKDGDRNKANTVPASKKIDLSASKKFKPAPTSITLDDDKLDAEYVKQMEKWPKAAGRNNTRKVFALLHAFDFGRIIVDEFQYLNSTSLHGIISLSARNRWLLSATPPIDTVAGINAMARLLGNAYYSR